MIGTTISHYRILEELGRGGMGEVFKAYDSQLNRFVALKFLPKDLAADTVEREHLRLEALAASSLIHPNIVVIFEINEHAGVSFLAMEYVEAVTLEKFIKEHAAMLSVGKVLDIVAQICDGMSAAHNAGIVHRDIKCENILLTPAGQVKIMDFGLALLPGISRSMKKGSTVGTLAYSSPELARGEGADRRSDIYSLGVVLYELLTHRMPFTADHAGALVDSILHDEPPSVRLYNPRVSPELDRIVSKALSKDPRNRYQNAGDLLVEVRLEQERDVSAPGPDKHPESLHGAGKSSLPPPRVSSRVVWGVSSAFLLLLAFVFYFYLRSSDGERELISSGGTSLAVLPFVNLSGTPDDDYFSDGLMEDIHAQVSKLNTLRVVPATSVMRYKGSSKPLRDIGLELGVGSVLQGSVRTADHRIRVVTQLLDVSSNTRIWSNTYDRELRDLFTIQTDLAKEIAAALRVELTSAEEIALRTKPTDNLEAYKLYLQARHQWRQRSSDGLQRATEYLRRAILMDTSFTLAYVGLADCYSLYPFYDIPSLSRSEAFENAERFARRALDVNPDLAEARASLGNILKESKWDWQNAEKEFVRAITLKPEYATGHQWYSECLRSQGRMREAIEEGKKAFALEPYSPIIGNIYGAAILYGGSYEESIPIFRRVLELDPNAPFARLNLAWACRFTNLLEEAEAQFHLAGIPQEIIPFFTSCRKDSGAIMFRKSAEGSLTNRQKEYLAMGFATCGEADRALEILSQLITDRWPNVQFLIRHPALQSLRKEPQYAKLMNRMGLSF